MGDYALDYPAILTNRDWQKNKGVIAKLKVGKTDVGAGLTELETLFGRTGFGKVKPFGGLNPAEFGVHRSELVKALDKEEVLLSNLIAKVGNTAKQAYADFQNSKMVPKSSTQHVADIRSALTELGKKAGDYSAHVSAELMEDFADAAKKSLPFMSLLTAADQVEANYKNLVACVAAVDRTTTPDEIARVFPNNNPARYVMTNCQAWDQAAKVMPTLMGHLFQGSMLASFRKLAVLSELADKPAQVVDGLKTRIAGGEGPGRVLEAFLATLKKEPVAVQMDFLAHFKTAKQAVEAVVGAL